MFDEQSIRQLLTEQLEEGETLLYLSIPAPAPNTFPIVEIAKSALIAAAISVMVFLALWTKHHNLDVARNCAIWGYAVFLVVLVVHSIFYFRQNARIVSAITDRAIIRFDNKGEASNRIAANGVKSEGLRLHRISFDTIETITLLKESDETGSLMYSLKGAQTPKRVYSIGVSNISSVRDALPKALITDTNLPLLRK